MLQEHHIEHVVLRTYGWLSAVAAVVALALLLSGHAVWAKEGKREGKNDRAVRLLATVRIPPTTVNNTAGGLYSFDISWVDQETETYYLADRSNKAVDIVDVNTNKLLGQLAATPPFAGVSPPAPAPGPNGVTTAGHCLFVTDAPSRVISFDTTNSPPTQVSDVKTDPTDPTRADELAVDPRDALILAINNASTPPFGTFIKFEATSCTLTPPDPATDRLPLDQNHGVDAQNGAEQPLWDPGTKKFYLSIPQIGPNVEDGGVVRIDPTTKQIDNTYGIKFCSPAGLTLGPHEDVLVGCNTIFDTAGNKWTGNADNDTNTAAPIYVILNVITGDQNQVPGAGVGDEVWFNKGDGNYYTASSGSPLVPLAITPARPPVGTAAAAPPLTAQGAAILGVIDAQDAEVLQLVPTFNVPAVTTGPVDSQHPSGTAHSVAVDAKNNHIFVPLAANNVYPGCTTGCIAVYWHGDEDEPGEAALP